MRPIKAIICLIISYQTYAQKFDTLTILFNPNQYILYNNDRLKIDTFIRSNNQFLVVQGHTDNTYTASYNIFLSQKRVNSVFSYLLTKQIDSKIITLNYFGKMMPKFPNVTNYYKHQNRRVEILKLKSHTLDNNDKKNPIGINLSFNQEQEKSGYDYVKDILIPILSPILAALTFILFIWQEKKKNNLQSKYQLDYGVNSVLKDAILFREAYQLYGLKINANTPITLVMTNHLKDLNSNLYKSLTQNPDIFHEYINKNYVASQKNTFPLLLSELQIRVDSLNTNSQIDNFILFGIYTFLYLFEKDEKKISENKTIRENIRNEDPDLFDLFIVNRKDGK